MKKLLIVAGISLIVSTYYQSIKGKEYEKVIERTILNESLKQFIIYDEKELALINSKVIDGTGDKIKLRQTIIIENGVIKQIGDYDQIVIPNKIKVIDLVGETVIPGLVGVHNHLHIPSNPFIGEVACKMYLGSGVTTIQTCGSASPIKEILLAEQIKLGEKLGPEILTSSPYFTGPGGSLSMIIPRNAQHIRDTMQVWINQGVSWFKVYRHTRPSDLRIILEEAHRNNCKVTGHFCSMTFEEAINLGIDGIEHGLNSASDFRTNKDFGVCNGGREYMDNLDVSSEEVEELHELMLENGVFLTSTLSIYESSVPSRAIADERSKKAMSDELLLDYEARRKRNESQPLNYDRESRLRRIMEFEYKYSKMGGLLGSGCDPGRHNMPGYGDQRNYELFREAGFSVEESIQILTSNGAKILEKPEIGTIEAGKRADLVILHGDLEKNDSVIREVKYVFKQGIGYDSKKILIETDGKVGFR